MTPRKATTNKEKKSAKKRKKQRKEFPVSAHFRVIELLRHIGGGVKNNCRECRKVFCRCRLQENHRRLVFFHALGLGHGMKFLESVACKSTG